MVTDEQIIQRRVKFAKQFAAQGATIPQAVKLSGVAESTAQRRGRTYDPLAAVIEEAVAPAITPQPKVAQVLPQIPVFAPPPPPPQCRPDEMLSGNRCVPRTVPGLGCFSLSRGQTIARGISLRGCPGQPGLMYIADFNDQSNLTTERYFSKAISDNQAALKAAGYKLPPSEGTLSRLTYDIGKAQQVAIKQCKAGYTNTSSCRSASERVTSLRKQQKDLIDAPFGWF